MNVYDVLQHGLMAAMDEGSITPEQARLASKWLEATQLLDEIRS